MPAASTPERLVGATAIRQRLAELYKQAESAKISMVYGICNIDLVKAYFPEWEWVSTNPTRSDTSLTSQFIYTNSEGPVFRSTDQMYQRESRYLPDSFSTNFTVIGDSVLFSCVEDDQPVGYCIQSQGLASDMLSLFRIIWDRAEA